MENNTTPKSKSPKMKLRTKWLLFSVGSLFAIIAGLEFYRRSIIKQVDTHESYLSEYAISLILIIGGLVAFGHSIILRSDLNRKKHYENKKPYYNKRNKPKKNKP